MASDIRKKIKALLAMAGDAGASDNEKEVAMRKAQELIEKFNVDLGSLEDFEEQIVITKGDIFGTGLKLPYHHVVAGWCAALYDCKHLIYKHVHGHAYWGMNHQVEAAEETFLWIIAQIEDLYRVALKAFDGQLTKAQRAELRASFKDAAAASVGQRIHRIIEERKQNRDSRALVVVDLAAQKLAEMMGGVKPAKPLALRQGFGANAGYQAGQMVKIQREVQSSDVMQRAVDRLKLALATGGHIDALLSKIANEFSVDPDALRARYDLDAENTRRIA